MWENKMGKYFANDHWCPWIRGFTKKFNFREISPFLAHFIKTKDIKVLQNYVPLLILLLSIIAEFLLVDSNLWKKKKVNNVLFLLFVVSTFKN